MVSPVSVPVSWGLAGALPRVRPGIRPPRSVGELRSHGPSTAAQLELRTARPRPLTGVPQRLPAPNLDVVRWSPAVAVLRPTATVQSRSLASSWGDVAPNVALASVAARDLPRCQPHGRERILAVVQKPAKSRDCADCSRGSALPRTPVRAAGLRSAGWRGSASLVGGGALPAAGRYRPGKALRSIAVRRRPPAKTRDGATCLRATVLRPSLPTVGRLPCAESSASAGQGAACA